MGIDENLLLTLLIVVVVFLIIRAVVLWYWRVNEGIELLKSIVAKLATLKFVDEKLAMLVNEAQK